MEKTRVTVSIAGKQYSIVSAVDPDYIKEVADYLNTKLKEVSENYPNIPETKIIVLAALNITDELFQVKKNLKEHPESEKIISNLTRRLSEIL